MRGQTCLISKKSRRHKRLLHCFVKYVCHCLAVNMLLRTCRVVMFFFLFRINQLENVVHHPSPSNALIIMFKKILIFAVMAAISVAFGLAVQFFQCEKFLQDLTGLPSNGPSNYGLLGVVMIFNCYMLMWLGINVGEARKKYGVKYPSMYADLHHSKNKKNANIFNCVQRAHQNTLEQQPTFLIFCALSSIQYPLVAGVAAFVWVLARFAYAAGYSSGDPKKRYYGAFGYFGLFVLAGCSWVTCLEQMGFDLNVLAKFMKR
eukprot:370865_1